MLRKYGIRMCYIGLAFILVFGVAALYQYSRGWPMYKPWAAARSAAGIVKPTIRKDTVIYREIRYLCGNRVRTKIPTSSALIGLDFTDMVKRYPPEESWYIDDSIKNTLILARMENRVCPYHQDFRHLGISDGFLAVYEGPLGFNGKVLQREDIGVESLPPEIQQELTMAMDYDNQTPDVQGMLKSTHEFETEAQLNTALENFDEFRE